MLSVSILGIKNNIRDNIKKLDLLNIDYFHVDVMDGNFVLNKTMNYSEVSKYLDGIKHKMDVHLMVNDVRGYVDVYKELNPEFITFHYEAVSDPIEIINYIRNYNIKVGISINPNTSVDSIKPYLEYVDLVLVMSVFPGAGGQKFIEDSIDKINALKELRTLEKYNYLIEVDGGINNITKNSVDNADIIVVGSYITDGDYREKINELGTF